MVEEKFWTPITDELRQVLETLIKQDDTFRQFAKNVGYNERDIHRLMKENKAVSDVMLDQIFIKSGSDQNIRQYQWYRWKDRKKASYIEVDIWNGPATEIGKEVTF